MTAALADTLTVTLLETLNQSQLATLRFLNQGKDNNVCYLSYEVFVLSSYAFIDN